MATKTLVRTPVADSIDSQLVASIISHPPWITLPGAFNARDVNGSVKLGYIFRSGTLENVTSEGLSELKELNVGVVFDLRSEKERAHHPEVEFGDHSGIKGVWVKEDDATLSGNSSGEATLISVYLSLLQTHAPAFRAIFAHVLYNPDICFLIHCTAGKDRTGVISALIHSLAGTPLEQIEHDYALTRIGIEPQRDFLLQKMLGGRLAGGKEIDLSNPRVRLFAEPPEDTMQQFLNGLDEKWAGVEGYLVKGLGFEKGEVDVMRGNLKGKSRLEKQC